MSHHYDNPLSDGMDGGERKMASKPLKKICSCQEQPCLICRVLMDLYAREIIEWLEKKKKGFNRRSDNQEGG